MTMLTNFGAKDKNKEENNNLNRKESFDSHYSSKLRLIFEDQPKLSAKKKKELEEKPNIKKREAKLNDKESENA